MMDEPKPILLSETPFISMSREYFAENGTPRGRGSLNWKCHKLLLLMKSDVGFLKACTTAQLAFTLVEPIPLIKSDSDSIGQATRMTL